MLIFFYGKDSFRSWQKVAEIKERFLVTDPFASGLSIFDYPEDRGKQKLLDVFGAPNLLAPKRLVIVRNLITQTDSDSQKYLLEYLKNDVGHILEDQDLVVVFWEADTPKKNNALFKFLESKAKKQAFDELAGMKLSQWIISAVKEADEKMAITNGAVEKLILFCGADTRVLNSQLQKLVNYCAGRNIEGSDVEILVEANTGGNIFTTIDALGNGNQKEAASLIQKHLKNGEDPFYLLAMFVYQFRNMLKVADLKEKFGMSEMEIARASKLHPFVVKKSLTQIRKFPLEKLRVIYQKLTDLDLQTKTGKIPIKVALDKIWGEL
jgi:DNA polymerase III delta subunit